MAAYLAFMLKHGRGGVDPNWQEMFSARSASQFYRHAF